MPHIPQGYSLFEKDLDHVLNLAEGDLTALRGAHLFITGGTGFFGIWLLESLLWASEHLELGLTLSVLSRDPETFFERRARHLNGRRELVPVRGTLTDFSVSGGPYSHIVHAASESNLENRPDWARRSLEAAIDGTRRLLDMAAAHRTEAVLLTTSGAVYLHADRIADRRFVEGPTGLADLIGEKSVYGEGKRVMEVLAAVGAQEQGYRASIARCFAFVGPYLALDSNYAVGNFIRDALAGRDVVVSSDGTPLRSYMYAADLVVWLLAILVRGANGRPYNVGGEQMVSIGELAHAVAKAAGTGAAVRIMAEPKPGAEPSAYVCDVSRAREDLGLTNGITLDEGLERTIAWHRMRAAPSLAAQSNDGAASSQRAAF